MDKIEINNKFNVMFALILVLFGLVFWLLFNSNNITENYTSADGNPFIYNTADATLGDVTLKSLTILGSTSLGDGIVITKDGIVIPGLTTVGDGIKISKDGIAIAGQRTDIRGVPISTNVNTGVPAMQITKDGITTKKISGSDTRTNNLSSLIPGSTRAITLDYDMRAATTIGNVQFKAVNSTNP